MPGIRMALIIVVIGFLVAALQIIIWRVSNRNAFFKYIPSIVLFIIALICIAKALWFSTGMEDLAYIVVTMIVAGVLIISLVTGIIIDVFSRIKK
jgi:hypothetical protein